LLKIRQNLVRFLAISVTFFVNFTLIYSKTILIFIFQLFYMWFTVLFAILNDSHCWNTFFLWNSWKWHFCELYFCIDTCNDLNIIQNNSRREKNCYGTPTDAKLWWKRKKIDFFTRGHHLWGPVTFLWPPLPLFWLCGIERGRLGPSFKKIKMANFLGALAPFRKNKNSFQFFWPLKFFKVIQMDIKLKFKSFSFNWRKIHYSILRRFWDTVFWKKAFFQNLKFSKCCPGKTVRNFGGLTMPITISL
jgi:hypothetical protein